MTPSPQQRILLVGYYGKGNFGDDLLLVITHALIKQHFPDAAISVIVDATHGDYVASMLGDVTLLKPDRHGHFDLIVHGGGGVFFDLKPHGLWSRMIEYAVCRIGFRTFLRIDAIARAITHKQRTSAPCRVALGVEVGAFSPGSPRMRANLPILADFKALWVRDTTSREHLKRFASILRAEIIQGSDLAFLTQHWLPAVPLSAEHPRPRLGIVLRDYPESLGGASRAALADAIATLAKDYTITGFLFDAHADPNTQALLAAFPMHIWQPERTRIAEFTQALGAQDVLLTSRAHGAICGACLGVPSVIVNIAPKLGQIHAMLPNASRLVPSRDTQDWAEAVAEAHRIPRATIAADVQQNRTASEAAWQEIIAKAFL